MFSSLVVAKHIYHTECEYLRLCCILLVSDYRVLPDLTASVLSHTPLYLPKIQIF